MAQLIPFLDKKADIELTINVKNIVSTVQIKPLVYQNVPTDIHFKARSQHFMPFFEALLLYLTSKEMNKPNSSKLYRSRKLFTHKLQT